MLYHEAFMEALECSASIRCSYAVICNANGRILFSLQSDRLTEGEPIITANYTEALFRRTRIPATCSERLHDLMQAYYAGYLDVTNPDVANNKYANIPYLNKEGKSLRRWLEDDSREIWIYPQQWDWKPMAETSEQTEQKKTNTLAWLLAAGSTLLN